MHPGPSDSNIYRKIEIEPWTEWFAWRPVKINNKRVWLKSIYRRCKWRPVAEIVTWEYSTLFDVIKSS